jgi:hypothetical protein
MRETKKNTPEFVVCLKNDGYAASLERHKIYRVLADPEAERHVDLRIVDESGEDYLYPKDWFVRVTVPLLLKLPYSEQPELAAKTFHKHLALKNSLEYFSEG